jgi:hypothetical protein
MTKTVTYSVPIKFTGTIAERIANFKTHQFIGEDGRCFSCDAKPGHAAADYPCGTSPARKDVTQLVVTV